MGRSIQLRPSVPNPTSAATRIDFTLLDGTMTAGDHTITWDGRSDEGRALGAGTYFYELDADGQRAARKAVLIP